VADIFISYKSEDRAAAKLFADALTAEGVSVWWDPVLRTGETYDEVIERNLRESALVVVLWSPRSVKSKWVRAEATIGERKGGLMPVLIEACDRPIAFELVQTADLAGWVGDRDDARWVDFMADLRNALSTRAAAVSAHTAPPPPDALTIETMFWSSIRGGGDSADFESYLQRYPNGQFAEIARARLARSMPPPVKGSSFDPNNYVFVSYPTDIAPELLVAIVRELRNRNLSIWLYDPSAYSFTDQEKAWLRWQRAGGSWEQQTLDAIRSASAVIALINEYSLQSRFQPREFELAAQQSKLLPVLISDLDYRALPDFIAKMHAPKITAEMLGADLGKNRLAMMASDAEALIARSRQSVALAGQVSVAAVPRKSEAPPARGSAVRWTKLAQVAILGAVTVAGVAFFIAQGVDMSARSIAAYVAPLSFVLLCTRWQHVAVAGLLAALANAGLIYVLASAIVHWSWIAAFAVYYLASFSLAFAAERLVQRLIRR
jgi:hypothetical protein